MDNFCLRAAKGARLTISDNAAVTIGVSPKITLKFKKDERGLADPRNSIQAIHVDRESNSSVFSVQSLITRMSLQFT